MKQRVYTLGSVAVVFIAIRWVHVPLPEDHEALPDPVQAFFKRHNLTDTFDAAVHGTTRPGESPDAPRKRHPVVIVPGIISCGLEVWKSKPCLGKFFRRRLWGGTDMAGAAISNASCWLEHLALNLTSGLDPDHVRVRAAHGLQAADYFVPGYWLWGKVIENLGDIGYTEEDILLECYDWRLAYPLLEKRDGYFSKMRHNIEHAVKHSGEKAVVFGHSMGAVVWLYFMNWVEQSFPGWVDGHIASFANVGGALLGAFGPLAAYLSGEMEATANLGPFGDAIDRYMISWNRARSLYWSFGGLASLLPIGGDAVWGSSDSGWTDTPADSIESTLTTELPAGPRKLEYLYELARRKFSNYFSMTAYNRGIKNPRGKMSDDNRDFANPLASALPFAPKLKIFCLYGVGIPTERAYKYSLKPLRWMWGDTTAHLLIDPSQNPFLWSSSLNINDAIAELNQYVATEHENRPIRLDKGDAVHDFPTVSAGVEFLSTIASHTTDSEDWLRIDHNFASEAGVDPWGNNIDGVFKSGVSRTDGDGTVPLLSLGYMCSNGWRDFPELNPANVSVWTKETQDHSALVLVDPRGGPATAKHVEIIGNVEFINDVLHIAAGVTSHLEQDRFISNITKIGPIVTERLRKYFGSMREGGQEDCSEEMTVEKAE
eukprot:TRINITY_DN90541_c0_g1_i1.p1 TRINITY_DN90541_c0_g1~~TRINITY_DN90541_c0_g1_i1.p1  ORF type:complete len:657 (-),score=63.95 TRINITY_DN90541_c0_g1_i1:15-1985(-)